MSLSKYPSALDDSSSIPEAIDRITQINALTYNKLRDALLSIEAELGIMPSREFSSVRARLDAIDSIINSNSDSDGISITSREFLAVVGVQDTSENTFERVGTIRVDPSIFSSSIQFSFEVSFNTTSALNAAQVRLYNVTDAAVVCSFTSTSTISDTQTASITLSGSLKDYEVQIKLTTADVNQRAIITQAKIIAEVL